MQDHQAADLRAQVPWRGGDLEQRFPDGAKQQVVDDGGMRRRHGRQFVRHGEHHVEILDGEQFLTAGLQPGRPVAGLALGTVPVAA